MLPSPTWSQVVGNLLLTGTNAESSSVGDIRINHLATANNVIITHQGHFASITLNSGDGPELVVKASLVIGNNLLPTQVCFAWSCGGLFVRMVIVCPCTQKDRAHIIQVS